MGRSRANAQGLQLKASRQLRPNSLLGIRQSHGSGDDSELRHTSSKFWTSFPQVSRLLLGCRRFVNACEPMNDPMLALTLLKDHRPSTMTMDIAQLGGLFAKPRLPSAERTAALTAQERKSQSMFLLNTPVTNVLRGGSCLPGRPRFLDADGEVSFESARVQAQGHTSQATKASSARAMSIRGARSPGPDVLSLLTACWAPAPSSRPGVLFMFWGRAFLIAGAQG